MKLTLATSYIEDIVYAWIGCHGMSDVLLPMEIWCPLYTLSLVISFVAPYASLQLTMVAMSALHFSHDMTHLVVDPPVVALYSVALTVLLLYRKTWLAQRVIVGYLCCVHTPLHVGAHRSPGSLMCMGLMFVTMINSPEYQHGIRDVIERSAGERDSRIHRAFLGVVGGHLATQVYWRTRIESMESARIYQ